MVDYERQCSEVVSALVLKMADLNPAEGIPSKKKKAVKKKGCF